MLISLYAFLSIFSILLVQLSANVHSIPLYYLASLLSGFFISIPYAMMEMVIMKECSYFKPNRALSLASLNTQAAAAVAGYPISLVFEWMGSFRYAIVLEAGLVVIATACLWIDLLLNRQEVSVENGKENGKEKED